MSLRLLLAAALVPVLCAAAPASQPLPVEHRIEAPEARQGVASDGSSVYVIDNSMIGRYRIRDGKKIASWSGDPEAFPHLNSCTLAEGELVCATSNYPALPQTSAIEFFDPVSLEHVRSVSLGFGPGSLTVIDRHEGAWWAVYANYDAKGGEPGRDHRYTLVARLDDTFRIERGWTLPQAVLERLAPKSLSGASWGADGRLYASGHDLPEIYVLELPEAGSVLSLVATLSVATHGQAIDFDPVKEQLLWSIDRDTRTVVASRVPPQPGD